MENTYLQYPKHASTKVMRSGEKKNKLARVACKMFTVCNECTGYRRACFESSTT